MMNKKILDIAAQLKGVVKEQRQEAEKALLSLPDGPTKAGLKALLSRASSGKLDIKDAQQELEKIVKNAS